MKPVIAASTLAFALVLAGCGGEEAPADTAATATQDTAPAAEAAPAAPAEPAPAPAEPVSEANAPLVAANLDHYVTGLTREIELLKGHADALAKARAGKDQAAELAALLALGSVEVRDAGAAAAGIDSSRYAHVKTQVDEVLAAAEMGALMKPQIEAAEQADISGYTEEQKKQHADGLAQLRAAWSDPYARLPADVLDAFKAREAELAKLRSEALALRLSAL